jgi:hypothetical protein
VDVGFGAEFTASLSLREHAAYEDALTLLPTSSGTAAARSAA